MRGVVRFRNQNIVHKNKRQTSQDVVHPSLEHGASAVQTKGHANKLKEAEGQDDGGLGDVVPEHLNLVILLGSQQGLGWRKRESQPPCW